MEKQCAFLFLMFLSSAGKGGLFAKSEKRIKKSCSCGTAYMAYSSFSDQFSIL